MTRTHWLLPLLLIGCSTQTEVPAGAVRKVTGQLSSSQLSRLDNPAIVLRTADGERRVAHVQRTGEFELAVPVGKSCHLAVATTETGGRLRESATINWPHRWTELRAGGDIELGVVHPRGGSKDSCKREGGGGDDDDSEGNCPSNSREADLPYDAKIPLGATWALSDSFREKGPLPSKVLSVTMEGTGAWRLAEIKAGTRFTVTQADCTHAGNRGTGRDRIEVKWQNADGSTESDHLDMRYCDGSTPPSANAVSLAPAGSPVSCESVELCDDEGDDQSDCDDDEDEEGVFEGSAGASPGSCGTPGGSATPGGADGGTGGINEAGGNGSGSAGGGTAPGGTGVENAPCTTGADCAAGLRCFQSKCTPGVN